MVLEHRFRHGHPEIGWRKQVVADLGVRAHERKLTLRESPRPREDFRRHGDLADVVDLRGKMEGGCRLAVPAESGHDPVGKRCHAALMTGGVGIAQPDGPTERCDRALEGSPLADQGRGQGLLGGLLLADVLHGREHASSRRMVGVSSTGKRSPLRLAKVSSSVCGPSARQRAQPAA
jgi:hypothetical protein